MKVEPTLRNELADRIDATISLQGGGSPPPFPMFTLLTAADVEVAQITLADPAFDAAVEGSISARLLPLFDLTAAGGIATKATVTGRAATLQFTMTVGLIGSGAEITMTDTNVGVGDTVELQELVITVPHSSQDGI